jgi:hypothetical protein
MATNNKKKSIYIENVNNFDSQNKYKINYNFSNNVIKIANDVLNTTNKTKLKIEKNMFLKANKKHYLQQNAKKFENKTDDNEINLEIKNKIKHKKKQQQQIASSKDSKTKLQVNKNLVNKLKNNDDYSIELKTKNLVANKNSPALSAKLTMNPNFIENNKKNPNFIENNTINLNSPSKKLVHENSKNSNSKDLSLNTKNLSVQTTFLENSNFIDNSILLNKPTPNLILKLLNNSNKIAVNNNNNNKNNNNNLINNSENKIDSELDETKIKKNDVIVSNNANHNKKIKNKKTNKDFNNKNNNNNNNNNNSNIITDDINKNSKSIYSIHNTQSIYTTSNNFLLENNFETESVKNLDANLNFLATSNNANYKLKNKKVLLPPINKSSAHKKHKNNLLLGDDFINTIVNEKNTNLTNEKNHYNTKRETFLNKDFSNANSNDDKLNRNENLFSNSDDENQRYNLFLKQIAEKNRNNKSNTFSDEKQNLKENNNKKENYLNFDSPTALATTINEKNVSNFSSIKKSTNNSEYYLFDTFQNTVHKKKSLDNDNNEMHIIDIINNNIEDNNDSDDDVEVQEEEDEDTINFHLKNSSVINASKNLPTTEMY